VFTTDNDFDHLIPDHLAGVVVDPKVRLRTRSA
jgi:hypothetical protein